MKVAIFDILKNTFMVVKNKNTTIVAVNKRPRRFKRNDGLYWLELGEKVKESRFKHFSLSNWKPTPVQEILTVFK